VLLIVIAAVVALALVGGGFMLMAQTPKTPSGPTVPSTPAQPTQPTTQPTEQPTTQPTEQPTEQPTQPTGGAVDLGYGVQFAVADGWQITDQAEGVIKVQDGKAMLITEVQKLEASNTANQLCEAYSKSLLKDQSGTKFGKAEKVAVNAKTYPSPSAWPFSSRPPVAPARRCTCRPLLPCEALTG